MAAVVRARNELVRVAIQIDPPKAIGRPRRLSTINAIQLIMYKDKALDLICSKICGGVYRKV